MENITRQSAWQIELPTRRTELEHVEWVPEGYRKSGLGGQCIAIAGHSHSDDGPDNEGFTGDCITKVISGDYRISFFTSIPRYFGFEHQELFWSNVLFFNFLPTKVGSKNKRYGYGDADQLLRGKARVLRILDQHLPDKLFVFSTKAWREFPPTIEDQGQVGTPSPLGWHTYVVGEKHRVKAIGLRHPQGANRAEMTQRVSRLMA